MTKAVAAHAWRSPSLDTDDDDEHEQPIQNVVWFEDGLRAALQDESGQLIGWLSVEQWWPDGERDAATAWVVSWFVPGGGEPYMYRAPVEIPALVAEDETRRVELENRAAQALASPPPAPSPFELPPPTPSSPAEWREHLDLQIRCWVDALNDLQAAGGETDAAAAYHRYRTLSDALNRVYALDSSLTILWRSLSAATREDLSKQADTRAAAAAAHNASIAPGFDVTTDPSFSAYQTRLGDKQPYRHWSSLLLAGVFQANFFTAAAWVRGQMVHAATSAPIDLRQFQPGAQPRWKWRPSSEFARGRVDEAGRQMYDKGLATSDVIGLFGHLVDVFAKAERLLVGALANQVGGP